MKSGKSNTFVWVAFVLAFLVSSAITMATDLIPLTNFFVFVFIYVVICVFLTAVFSAILCMTMFIGFEVNKKINNLDKYTLSQKHGLNSVIGHTIIAVLSMPYLVLKIVFKCIIGEKRKEKECENKAKEALFDKNFLNTKPPSLIKS